MASGKGVQAGGESFDSEDDIIALMRHEGVNTKHLIGAAVDFISFALLTKRTVESMNLD
jgi:hypothetical protein